MAPVPELAAKRAKRDQAWQTQKAADALETRKKAKETRRVIFKKAAQYVSEFRQQVRGPEGPGMERGGEAACVLAALCCAAPWAALKQQQPRQFGSYAIPQTFV
jgi:hypothetical protein